MTSPPTGPPPGDTPDGNQPPEGNWPPGGVPPGYPPPPPGYPPPGYPYHASGPQPRSRISVGMAFAGTVLYFATNFILGFLAFGFAGSVTTDSVNGVFVATAALLVLIAFGGGGALLASRSPSSKGLGLGLMIGWALTSLITVGFCTGINPALYSA